MFRASPQESGSRYQRAVVGLLALSAAALAVTIWVELDFLREQELVEQIMRELPSDSTASAEALAGELKWQFRLTILVVLNLVVTGFAVVLLSRAYHSSQESLRDVKALASDILGGMEQAVITTDTDGAVTSINRRGLEFLHHSEEECLGRSLEQISVDVPLEQFRTDWMVEQAPAMTRDFRSTAGDGERTLRAFCQNLTDADKQLTGYVLQLRDVTNRIQIEERMRRMERYMGLGSLAAGLHHEIKNPLAALSLHVQLLEEQLESEPSAEVHRMLGVIRTEIDRVGGVLEGFRDATSMGRLNLEPVDLRLLLERQVELARPRAEQQGVKISTSISTPAGFEISADQVRLEQVLLNLFINALDAMRDGGLLQVRCGVDGANVLMEVADTGAGIPEELLDKVFDLYFTTKSDGSGLGLTMCDKIVRQHDGSLDVYSSSQGATFRITLPTSPELTQRQ